MLALKVREHFPCLCPTGTLDTSSPSQQGTSPSAEGGAEEGTSAGRVSGGVWADQPMAAGIPCERGLVPLPRGAREVSL